MILGADLAEFRTTANGRSILHCLICRSEVGRSFVYLADAAREWEEHVTQADIGVVHAPPAAAASDLGNADGGVRNDGGSSQGARREGSSARASVGVGRDRLTEGEVEVLALMADGLSNKEIGRKLWLSEDAVKSRVRNIMDKMPPMDGVYVCRPSVVAWAVREKIVP